MTRRSFVLGLVSLATPHATAITVRGRLDATKDEADAGRFTLNADQLDAPLVLETPRESYLQMFFDGCIGHALTVTVTPQ